MDWNALGRTIFEVIDGAMAAVLGLLENIDWGAVGKAILDALGGAILTLAGDVGNLTDSIFEAIQNSLSGLQDKLTAWFIDRLIDVLNVLKAYLGDVPILGEAIDAALQGLEGYKGELEDAGKEIGASIKQGVEKSNIGESVELAIKSIGSVSIKINPTLEKQLQDAGKTLFNNLKTGLDDSASAYTWGQNVGTKYASGIENKASVVNSKANVLYGKVKNQLYWDGWYGWGQNVGNKFGAGIGNKAGVVNSKAAVLYSKVKYQLYWDGWFNWGQHVADKFAAGMNKNAYKVSNAASGLAGRVKSYIGFSEPEMGPLSDFHTFMPDMLDLMAKGIHDESDLVINELDRLAENMRDAIPSDIDSDVALHGSYDLADVNATMANAVAMGTVGIGNATTNSNRPVELVLRVDGRELARATYSNLDDLMTAGYVNAEFV